MADYGSEREKLEQIGSRFGLTLCPVNQKRCILMEGREMKLCRRGETKLRHFYLLTDFLIYSNAWHNNPKIIPLSDATVELTRYKNDDWPYAFQINSTVKSFIVLVKDDSRRQDWIRRLNHVIQSQAHKPNQAPLWTPDNQTDQCPPCKKEFTFTFRRHHCRQCGTVMCSECSSFNTVLKNHGELVKICAGCHTLNANAESKFPVPRLISKDLTTSVQYRLSNVQSLRFDLRPETLALTQDNEDQWNSQVNEYRACLGKNKNEIEASRTWSINDNDGLTSFPNVSGLTQMEPIEEEDPLTENVNFEKFLDRLQLP